MRRLRARAGLGWLSLVLCGCFPKAGVLPGPLPAQAIARAQTRWPDANAENLERGRAQFVTYCDNCHHYPDLPTYSEAQWPGIARRMSKKAGISAEDSDRLLRFILAARAEAETPTSPDR